MGRGSLLACLGLLSGALTLASCGSYSATTKAAREEFYAGKFTDAAKSLEHGAHEEGNDQVLFLFDRATALHQAGDYEESNKDFHLVDKLTEIKDYTSLAAEAATLLTNDKIIPYKGEGFEKVLISQYLALNYLMLNKHEDALVECRRVNHKFHQMVSQGKRKYQLSPMANYVTALLYEDQKEWNDAYVDYQATQKLAPDLPYIGEDLYRLAWRNKIRDHQEMWAEKYGLSPADQQRIRETANLPEIVLIVENGRAPEKQPNPNWTALPHYVPRYNPVAYAEVSINGQVKGRTEPLYNVEKVAIADLDDKYAGILAKKIAGVVAKEVVANQVEKQTGSELLGALTRIGMHAINQADTRSWLTLPKDFQIFRVRVAPGNSYTIRLNPKAVDGSVASPQGMSGLEKIVSFPDRANPKDPRTQRVFVPIRIL